MATTLFGEKLKLLTEMLDVSEDLISLLKQSEELDDELLEAIDNSLNTRDELISHISEIDRTIRQSKYQDNPEVKTFKESIQETLGKLVECQATLDEHLMNKKGVLGGKMQQTRHYKRTLKGYFNNQIASRPSFIDDKR